jgi:hypothetical protein
MSVGRLQPIASTLEVQHRCRALPKMAALRIVIPSEMRDRILPIQRRVAPRLEQVLGQLVALRALVPHRAVRRRVAVLRIAVAIRPAAHRTMAAALRAQAPPALGAAFRSLVPRLAALRILEARRVRVELTSLARRT